MQSTSINGVELKNMLMGGVSYLKNNEKIVNELNVFPVPDGDTGLNMIKTLEGGLKLIYSLNTNSVSEVMSEFSKGALMGARGNSGVILSQILRKISIGKREFLKKNN